MQIAKADLENHDTTEIDNPTDTENANTDVASNKAPVRESGTVYEPETSNFNHFGEPAPVRPPLGEDTE